MPRNICIMKDGVIIKKATNIQLHYKNAIELLEELGYEIRKTDSIPDSTYDQLFFVFGYKGFSAKEASILLGITKSNILGEFIKLRKRNLLEVKNTTFYRFGWVYSLKPKVNVKNENNGNLVA